MVDVTQTMACIQCGACVSDCLAMEVDPLFIGPAALAKAYRFVGDPRDDEHFVRLNDLAQDKHGMFDCTHCFKCVDACPKDVNPMGQIMRLRRIATADHHIVDQNNGERHEAAFASLIRDNGLLWEAELLPRSYGGNSWLGKFHPRAAKELISSLPSIVKALARGKVTPMGALKPHRIPKPDLKSVQSIYERIDGRDRSSGQRFELNLYIVGEDEKAPPPEEHLVAGVVADGVASLDEPLGVPAAEGEQPAEPNSPEGSTSL
jgi:succinate dehydrogenase / fumarate reductase iron-sulfur subunit